MRIWKPNNPANQYVLAAMRDVCFARRVVFASSKAFKGTSGNVPVRHCLEISCVGIPIRACQTARYIIMLLQARAPIS